MPLLIPDETSNALYGDIPLVIHLEMGNREDRFNSLKELFLEGDGNEADN
jgi:hypothetical protein